MYKTFTMLLFVILFVPVGDAGAVGDSTIQIPVRFHIVHGLDMQKRGVTMASWIEKSELNHTVLPEVNRIWQQANIQFVLDEIVTTHVGTPANKSKMVQGIVDAKRDAKGKSDPKRIKKLNKLIPTTQYDPTIINVYLVPYLGEASQGHAKPNKKRVYIGLWTDKASKAKLPPKQFQLVEARPMKEGSLSRTVAHELGHILGLKHPDKSSQKVFQRLMGGKRPGYDLTLAEISTARQQAKVLRSHL